MVCIEDIAQFGNHGFNRHRAVSSAQMVVQGFFLRLVKQQIQRGGQLVQVAVVHGSQSIYQLHIAAAGIRNAVWRGRMEEIQDGVYLDGAHNEGGIRAFAGAAAEVAARRREESGKDGRIFLLFAAVSDKNYESMLETLMRKLKPDRLVLTHLYTSRALPMEAMEKAAHRVAEGCEVQSIPDVKTAYQTLVQEKRPEDTCFCVGSMYLIGELEKKIS